MKKLFISIVRVLTIFLLVILFYITNSQLLYAQGNNSITSFLSCRFGDSYEKCYNILKSNKSFDVYASPPGVFSAGGMIIVFPKSGSSSKIKIFKDSSFEDKGAAMHFWDDGNFNSIEFTSHFQSSSLAIEFFNKLIKYLNDRFKCVDSYPLWCNNKVRYYLDESDGPKGIVNLILVYCTYEDSSDKKEGRFQILNIEAAKHLSLTNKEEICIGLFIANLSWGTFSQLYNIPHFHSFVDWNVYKKTVGLVEEYYK